MLIDNDHAEVCGATAILAILLIPINLEVRLAKLQRHRERALLRGLQVHR